MVKKKTKAKPKKNAVVRQRLKLAPPKKQLAHPDFDPTLFVVTIHRERHEGEWFHVVRAPLLPDVCVYEHSPSEGYESLMEVIRDLHATAMEEGRSFPSPLDDHPLHASVQDIELKKALEFYDKARADEKGHETGAVKDGHEWVLSAARCIAGRAKYPAEPPPLVDPVSKSAQKRVAAMKGETAPPTEGERL